VHARPESLEIREGGDLALGEYASVPIGFEVTHVLDVVDTPGPNGPRLRERKLDAPYWKDYDSLDGASPIHVAAQFDTANWAAISARAHGVRSGGALAAFDTPSVHLLEGRRDLVVLWDLRVAPQHRRRGVGRALFQAVERWAVGKGCTQLKVETQNVNVPACRFYARQGCALGAIDRSAYPQLPGEIQLLWWKDLRAP